MRRSLFILLGVVLVSVVIVGLSSVLSRRLCARHLVPPGDDLAWLRREFRLSDADMQRIRVLHDGYLPLCASNCARIEAKRKEFQAALDASPGLSAEAERKLGELNALRAQCQAHMLRHFHAVSQAMPAEQGRRYLAEMQRLTLGFHDQFERAMTAPAASAHGHH